MKPERVSWLILPVIMLATFAAFWPAIHSGFVDWDDDKNFLLNPYYRGLGWAQLKWMFTTFHLGPYQPLCWLTFGLDYTLWGMNPYGYHLSNVLLHVLNAVLFYFITLRLLRLGFPDIPTDHASFAISSAFSALFFSVHPLRVESVAWVTERKDVLSGTFFLATLLFYFKACAKPSHSTGQRRNFAAALISYVLSLSAKAMGMTLPVVLIILDIYPLRRLSGNLKEWLSPRYRPVLLEKVPFLLAASAAGIAALVGQHQQGAMQSLAHSGAVFRLEMSFSGLVFYLVKTLAPFRLLPLYDVPVDLKLPLSSSLLNVGIVLAFSAALISLRRRWPAGLAAWTYYVISLLPVLGIVPVGYQLAADRYTYLPCLAWPVLAGGAVLYGLNKLAAQRRTLLLATLCAGIIGLSFLTWHQAGIWHDSVTLWKYDFSANPESATAHDNLSNAYNRLGVSLAGEGRLTEAIAAFKQALAMSPGYIEPRNNLGLAENRIGTVLAQQGRLAEAITEYTQALALRPDDAEAHNNLGVALAQQGRFSEAIEYFQQALRLQPNYPQARNNLQRALAIHH